MKLSRSLFASNLAFCLLAIDVYYFSFFCFSFLSVLNNCKLYIRYVSVIYVRYISVKFPFIGNLHKRAFFSRVFKKVASGCVSDLNLDFESRMDITELKRISL